MMKLFKILIPIFVLLFSSSVVAEFPTKIFNIQLYDDVKNYTKDQKSLCDSYNDCDVSESDYNPFELYHPNPEDEFETMETNSYFQYYRVHHDLNDKIVHIGGYSDYKNPNEHLSICFDEVDHFADFLKSYYSLKKEFEKNYFMTTYISKFEGLEDLIRKTNVYERRITYKINGKKSVLSISCQVPENIENQYYGNIISFELFSQSFEDRSQEYSDANYSSTIDYFNYSEFINNFEELGFDDFNGF